MLTLLGVLGVEVGREETLGEWDMSWVRLDTKTLVSLRESLALRMAEGGLLAALSPRAPIPETKGDTPVARGELWRGELLALSLPRPVENGYVSCFFNWDKKLICVLLCMDQLMYAVYCIITFLCSSKANMYWTIRKRHKLLINLRYLFTSMCM